MNGLNTVCALIFAGFVVQNLLDSLLDSFEDVVVSNRELHPKISHLQGGMDAFHWRKAWLYQQKKQEKIRSLLQ